MLRARNTVQRLLRKADADEEWLPLIDPLENGFFSFTRILPNDTKEPVSQR